LRADGQTGPDLMAMLDLVGLATVADVAPLIGVNRAFVRRGLQVMARRARPGLAALADVAKLNQPPAAYHLGYLIGPRVNAGGRVGQADLGAKCLATDNPSDAQRMAAELDRLNKERRIIEADVQEEALAIVAARGDGPLAWAAGDGWHPGVVGIVASRVKEAVDRPSVIIGFDGEIGKGSGRSVPGVDLGASVQRLASEGLLTKGGGHRMAAGLTVTRENLDAAMTRLGDLLERQGAGQGGPRDLDVSGLLMPGAATPDLFAEIEAAGPFGAAAPAPRFAFADQAILHAREVGDGHLKLSFGDGLGAKLDAIAFGQLQSEMGQALINHGGGQFHLAGRLSLNHWGGREMVQLQLEDAAAV
ncbi:MAG: DHHA1 domain-containing protein, partial [Pseudomonadota bacterium]